MKKAMRKNQMIVTALAIMIVVAGYLNFTGQEISTSGLVASQSKGQTSSEEDASSEESSEEETADTETADLSAEDEGEDEYSVNDDGEVVASEENPGEAVMVSNTLSSDYFSSAKLSREQSRAKNKETLLEIVNNEALSTAERKAAVKEVAAITEAAEKENVAELMLEAKGFADSVVSISEDSVDVVVNATELTSREIAQIEDIVKRKTGIAAENIVITPVRVEE